MFHKSSILNAIQKYWKFGTVAAGVSGSLLYNKIKFTKTYRSTTAIAIPSKLPWVHNKFFKGYDHASLRRGYEVYKQVCASCHSLKLITYNHLIGVTHTEAEAKAEAIKQAVLDGPDENGAMYLRCGQLADHMTGPYINDQEARYANNGYLPPDLSWFLLGKRTGEDYMFHLLTNFMDPPAGITIGKDQHYNPYFRGGVIGMPPVIHDGVVKFADGTPASAPQVAKDVVSFLKWAADQTLEDRKKSCLKFIKSLIVFFFILLITGFYLKNIELRMKIHKFKELIKKMKM